MRAIGGYRLMAIPGELEAVRPTLRDSGLLVAGAIESESLVDKLVALANRVSTDPGNLSDLKAACQRELQAAGAQLKASGQTPFLPLLMELEQGFEALSNSPGANDRAAVASAMRLLAGALRSSAPPPRSAEILAIAGLRSLRGARMPWRGDLILCEVEMHVPSSPAAEVSQPHPRFIRRALAAYRKGLLKFLKADPHEAKRLAELSRRVKEVCVEDAERRRWRAAEAVFSRAQESGQTQNPLVKRMAVRLEQVLRRLSGDLPADPHGADAMIEDLAVIAALLDEHRVASDDGLPLRLSADAFSAAAERLGDKPEDSRALLAELADALLLEGEYAFWLEARELTESAQDPQALRAAISRWQAPSAEDGNIASATDVSAHFAQAHAALSRIEGTLKSGFDGGEIHDRAAGIPVDETLLDNLNLMAREIRGARSRAEANLGSLRGGLVDMERTIRALRSQLESLEVESQAEDGERSGAGSGDTVASRFGALSRGIEELAGLKDSLQSLTEETESALAAQAGDDTELEQGLLKTRMMPVGGQFEALCQCVQRAAAARGVVATLSARGAEVALERSRIDALTRALEYVLEACVGEGLITSAAPARPDPAGGRLELEISQPRFDVIAEVSYPGAPLSNATLTHLAPALDALGAMATSFADGNARARARLLIPGPPQPMDLLLVEAGEKRYALPLKHVSGVSRTPGATELKSNEGVMEVDGRRYRLTALSEALGLESSPVNGSMCVLVQRGESRFACRVDTIIGRQRLLVRSPGPLLSSNPWVLGVVLDALAAPTLVLDLGTLENVGVSRAV